MPRIYDMHNQMFVSIEYTLAQYKLLNWLQVAPYRYSKTKNIFKSNYITILVAVMCLWSRLRG